MNNNLWFALLNAGFAVVAVVVLDLSYGAIPNALLGAGFAIAGLLEKYA